MRFEHIQESPSEPRALNQPDAFGSTTLENLKEVFLSIFSKNSFEAGVGTHSWNSILNATLVTPRKPDRGQATGLSTSINRLSMSNIENGECQVKFVKRQAAFDAR